MLTNTSRWSHARGNEVVPSRWQATLQWYVPQRQAECCQSLPMLFLDIG